VEDKKAHTATVYQSGKPIVTVNTATGKNKGDDLTVTTTGGRGKDGPIIHGAGNMSTPAGMFRINSTGIYRGNKSFQRSKVYEDYNIASSVHTGNVPSNKEQCNISNGCTRITPEGANQLSKYVGKNTRWYILPEKETTGQFLNYTEQQF
jgi:lipoprotein-anchoring transpeptidase ErfK/SrfK